MNGGAHLEITFQKTVSEVHRKHNFAFVCIYYMSYIDILIMNILRFILTCCMPINRQVSLKIFFVHVSHLYHRIINGFSLYHSIIHQFPSCNLIGENIWPVSTHTYRHILRMTTDKDHDDSWCNIKETDGINTDGRQHTNGASRYR